MPLGIGEGGRLICGRRRAKVKSPAMLEHMSVAAVASNRTPTVAVLGILIDCDMDSPLQLTGAHGADGDWFKFPLVIPKFQPLPQRGIQWSSLALP